jgi:hypothetical protein
MGELGRLCMQGAAQRVPEHTRRMRASTQGLWWPGRVYQIQVRRGGVCTGERLARLGKFGKTIK